MVKDGRGESLLRSKMPPSSGHPLKGSCTGTLFSPGPKPQGVCPTTAPAEARESAAGRQRRAEEDRTPVQTGMGCGSLQGRRRRPGTRFWERQRGKGRGGRLQTCQQPGQGEPRLLAPSHSHSFHRRRPNFRTSSQGEGASLQPRRSQFRTEAGRPVSQQGRDSGSKLVGLQR